MYYTRHYDEILGGGFESESINIIVLNIYAKMRVRWEGEDERVVYAGGRKPRSIQECLLRLRMSEDTSRDRLKFCTLRPKQRLHIAPISNRFV